MVAVRSERSSHTSNGIERLFRGPENLSELRSGAARDKEELRVGGCERDVLPQDFPAWSQPEIFAAQFFKGIIYCHHLTP